MKCLQKFSKEHNSVIIQWTVTSKQYALLHIRSTGQMDIEGHNIIPPFFKQAYKN